MNDDSLSVAIMFAMNNVKKTWEMKSWLELGIASQIRMWTHETGNWIK